MPEPTEELLDLIFFALDHAVKGVIHTNGPVIPFAVVVAANGEQTLARFTTGRNPDAARLDARAHVARTADCVRYAVAACGTISENGQRSAVVMVEGGQRSEPHGFMFVQRFTSTSKCRFAQAYRNPGIIDLPAILEPANG